jgi:hypothetical protein
MSGAKIAVSCTIGAVVLCGTLALITYQRSGFSCEILMQAVPNQSRSFFAAMS